MEDGLSFEDIMFFRSIAEAQLSRDEKKAAEQKQKETAAKKSKKEGGGWFKKKKTVRDTESAIDEEGAIAIDEDTEKAFYDLIEYDPAHSLEVVGPRDWVKTSLRVSVQHASMSLAENHYGIITPLIELDLDDIIAQVAQRPDSMLAEVSMQSLTAHDRVVANSIFPQIITPLEENHAPFIHSIVELNPLDGHAGKVVTLTMLPLIAVYSKDLVLRLLRFVNPAGDVSMVGSAESAAAPPADAPEEEIVAVNTRTWSQLEEAREAHSTIDLNLKVHAPIVVIPKNLQDKRSKLIVANLGVLRLESCLSEIMTMEEIRAHRRKNMQGVKVDLFYDPYKLNLSNIEVYMTKHAPNTRWLKRNPEQLLVEPFDVVVALSQAITPTDASLTKILVDSRLPNIHLRMSPQKYLDLMEIVGSAKPAPAELPVPPHLLDVSSDDAILYGPITPMVLVSNSLPEAQRLLLAKRVSMDISFTLEEFTASLLHDVAVPGSNGNLIVLSVKDASTRVVKRAFDQSIYFNLQQLQVEDCYQQVGPDFQYLVDSATAEGTPDETSLISVVFSSSGRHSPLYNNVDKSLRCHFGNLACNMNRETIRELLKVSGDLTEPSAKPLPALPAVVGAEAAESRGSEDHANEGDEEIALDLVAKRAPSSKAKMSLAHRLDLLSTIKLSVTMGTFSLTLNELSTRMHITKCVVGGLTADIDKRQRALAVKAKLQKLRVLDMTERGKLVPELVHIEGQEVAVFEFFTHTAGLDGYDSPPLPAKAFDSRVRLYVSTITVTALNRVIQDLSNYSKELSSLKYVLDRSANATADAAADALASNFRKRLDLDIHISSPCVVVPRSTHSKHGLVVNLGSLLVQGDTKPLPASRSLPPKQPQSILSTLSSDMTVSLSAVSVRCGFIPTLLTHSPFALPSSMASWSDISAVKTSNVVEPCDFGIHVVMPLDPHCHAVPQQNVVVSVSDLLIEIDKEEYTVLMGVVNENLKEPPTILPPPPVVLRRARAHSRKMSRRLSRTSTRRRSSMRSRAGTISKSLTAAAPSASLASPPPVFDQVVARVVLGVIKATVQDLTSPLMELNLAGVAGFFQMQSDGVQTGHLEVGSLMVKDMRESFGVVMPKIISHRPVAIQNLAKNLQLSSTASPTNGPVKECLLAVLLVTDSNGEKRVQATMDSPRILAVPEFINAVAVFFTTPPPSLAEVSLADSSLTSLHTTDLSAHSLRSTSDKFAGKDNEEEEEEEDGGDYEYEDEDDYEKQQAQEELDLAACSKPRPQLDVTLWVGQPELLFVEEGRNPESRALRLCTTMIVKYEVANTETMAASGAVLSSSSLRAQLHSTMISVCRVHAPAKTSLPILHPFDMTFAMNMDFAGALPLSNTIDGYIEPIVVDLSFSDISLCQNIAKALQPQKAPSDTTPVAKPPELAKQSSRALLQSEHIPSPKDRFPNLIEFSLCLDFVDVKLTDDSFGSRTSPLLSFYSSTVMTEGRAQRNEVRALVTAAASAAFFNPAVSAWEPLLEPANFSVQLSQTPNFDAATSLENPALPPLTSVLLTTDGSVELNLSPPCVLALQKVGASFSQSGTAANTTADQTVPYSPYWLHNDTGTGVRVKLSTHQAAANSPLQMMQIAAGKKHPFSFGSDLSPDANPREMAIVPREKGHGMQGLAHWRSTQANTRTISLQVEGFEPVKDVNVHCVGRRLVILKPSVNALQYRLVVDVGLSPFDSAKIISIRSPLTLHNATTTPLRFHFAQEQSPALVDFSSEPVLPNSWYPVPLSHAYTGIFKVQPVGTQYQACTSKLKWDRKDSEDKGDRHFFVTCPPLPCTPSPSPSSSTPQKDALDENRQMQLPFRLALKCSMERLPGLQLRASSLIQFNAPLTLQNVLLAACEYKLTDACTGIPLEGELAPGESADIHHIDPRHAQLLAVRPLQPTAEGVNLYSWSESSFIHSVEKNAALAKTLEVVAHDNSVFLVHIEHTLLPSGARVVSLFAPFVAVNNTDFGIVCRPTNTDASSSASEILIPASPDNPLCFSPSELKSSSPSLTDLVGVSDAVAQLGKRARMFSYGKKEPLFGSKTKMLLRTENGGWSKKLNTETAGSVGVLQLPHGDPAGTREVGVAISLLPSIFRRTRVVLLSPRLILVNTLAHRHVEVMQECRVKKASKGKTAAEEKRAEQLAAQALTLPPNQPQPFHLEAGHPPRLHLRFTDGLVGGSDRVWSGGFDVSDVADFCVKMAEGSNGYFARVSVIQVQHVVFVMVKPEDRSIPPYRIENHTNFPVTISQVGCNDLLAVPALSAAPYTWENVCGEKKVEVHIGPHLVRKQIPLNVISRHKNLGRRFQKDEGKKKKGAILDMVSETSLKTFEIEIQATGITRIMYIVDKNRALLTNGSSPSLSSSISLSSTSLHPSASTGSLSSSSLLSDDDQDAESVNPVPLLQLSVAVEAVGVSVVGHGPQELLYLRVQAIDVDLTQNDVDTRAGLVVKHVELLNQLPIKASPFVILPTKVAERATAPFIKGTVIKSNVLESVTFIHYASFQVQEMELSLDDILLQELMRFANFRAIDSLCVPKAIQLENIDMGAEQFRKKCELFSKILQVSRPPVLPLDSTSKKQLFIELLHLNPFKANVTFVAGGGAAAATADDGDIASEESALIYRNSVATTLQSFGLSFVNVDRAPLCLNSILLENPFISQQALVNKLIKHYKQQTIVETYKILGSVDLLGNPVGLLTSIGTGVKDFFYEPAKGIVKSPAEFGRGIAVGTASLLKNTLYGVFNTATKVTSAVGKGVASLSMDSEYLAERQASQLHKKPHHAGEGLVYGARDLGIGLYKGVTGIFSQPVKGAVRGGPAGFFRGLGKGIVGIVTKPAAGVLDFAAQTTAGLRNTTVYLDSKAEPCRFPRYISPDGLLLPFNANDAYAQNLMRACPKYRSDRLTAHYVLGSAYFLITSRHILRLNAASSKIEWALSYEDVIDFSDSPTGILVAHLMNNSKNKLQRTKATQSIIPVVDTTFRTNILAVVNSTYEQYQAATL